MKYNVDGKYPMMANWLLVSKLGNGMYSVKNILTDEMYEMDNQTYRFLHNLNGNRNPYKLASKLGVDAEELMDYYDMNLLIRTEGRELLADGGTILHTVYIPSKHRTNSIIPKLYNYALFFGWLPVLLYGFYRILFTSYRFNADYMLLGYIFAIVTGLTMHELSHAMACLCYGGSFFEAGIMWQKFYPGAYVLIDKSGIGSKLKRVQVDAAGAEMNLMLTGIFLTLSSVVEVLSGFFLYAAMINGILAVFNLAFIDGLDGSSVLGELIGLQNGVDGAKNLLRKELKWNSADASENKKVAIASCAIIVVYQILLPIVLVNNILSIIGGFL